MASAELCAGSPAPVRVERSDGTLAEMKALWWRLIAFTDALSTSFCGH